MIRDYLFCYLLLQNFRAFRLWSFWFSVERDLEIKQNFAYNCCEEAKTRSFQYNQSEASSRGSYYGPISAHECSTAIWIGYNRRACKLSLLAYSFLTSLFVRQNNCYE